MLTSKLFSGLLGLIALWSLSPSSLSVAHAAGTPPPLPGICSESDRFGVAVAGWIGGYDVQPLHAGWYHNFTILTFPPRPNGMQYVQTIRLADDGPFADKACSVCPTWEELQRMVQNNPSSLWIIGNEQDRQDYVGAAHYAQLYHDFYTFLKAKDPTCLVGIGGVVQPTPIRLQYLDLILTAYNNQYGAPMPVEVWNVHNYVLREKRWYEGCPDCWGCGIPPDIPTDTGQLYDIQDHDNMGYWTWHIILMRQWMRDRGYQDRPLIITEFGILMPEMYGYTYPRVRQLMLATFDWMLTATDPNIGYPADGYRLVQAWSWYSLNDPAFEGWPSWNHLFDPNTRTMTALGQDFAAYTASLTNPLPGSIDLQPTSVWHTPPTPETGDLVTVTILANIYNGGAATAENVLVRFERDGQPAGEVILPTIGAGSSQVASVVWTGLARWQSYQVAVTANPDGQIIECDTFNNRLAVPMLVTGRWTYLPLISKK